ncbi:adenosylcobinamide-phosphate guanylyltransferase [Methanimicrococcus blatticola]|uniref:Adenosylcobinamide-phosphate guanylyltransferase n=2 Tax=Methanimicrococcus blatticola TaxID=91560 RepID=A0A484F3X0_9EURY|nr:adenosylcobinamide-phosphate guanylyltransferase [Methanimicrococcus blatticola]
MAGGLAQRMGCGEKSCIELNGRPLISYIINALDGAKGIDNIHVSVTQATPETKKLIEADYPEIHLIEAAEGSYVGDMIYSIKKAELIGPVMVVMCDLPLVRSDIIDEVLEKYETCDEPALSVYVPIALCKKIGIRPDTVFHKNTKLIVPTGINILDASDINNEQPDYNYIVDDPRLAMNVNTPEDLAKCRQMLSEGFE